MTRILPLTTSSRQLVDPDYRNPVLSSRLGIFPGIKIGDMAHDTSMKRAVYLTGTRHF